MSLSIEKLIEKIDGIVNQTQKSLTRIQEKLDVLLETCEDPTILASIMVRQTQAVKTLAEATKTLSILKQQGEDYSDKDWLKEKT